MLLHICHWIAARLTDSHVDGAVGSDSRLLGCGMELVGSGDAVGVESIDAGGVVTEQFMLVILIGCSSWYGASV